MEKRRSISREEELYGLWESRASPGTCFRGLRGERVVVISAGRRNDLAGPDYLDAVLLIDAELKVGPVEMHRSEGEWFMHGHQNDAAYADVILHVLGERPGAPRLPIPTIDAAALFDAARPSATPAAPDLVTPEQLAEQLAELAWGRLLRRVTEIVRAEPELPTADRLRRAFIRRLFDALGYTANRSPMGQVARELLAREEMVMGETFDGIAAAIFNASGLDRGKIVAAGRCMMSESRLCNILKNYDLPPQIADWRYDTRPANAPERRLWGAARLVFDVYRDDLLHRLHAMVVARRFDAAATLLVVRADGSTLVGPSRAGEIVLNALLPVALAAGILSRNRSLIEGASALYREAPSSGTNRLVRRVEERFLAGGRLAGAFWQQGAIEFHQRYLLPDRSGLSFVAEAGLPAARSST